jgi:hypothetical protein
MTVSCGRLGRSRYVLVVQSLRAIIHVGASKDQALDFRGHVHWAGHSIGVPTTERVSLLGHTLAPPPRLRHFTLQQLHHAEIAERIGHHGATIYII